ncbi:MAG: hypothetical protein ACHQ4F_00005, partial [Candidatus Dormibacteria bacterium]
GIPAVGGGTKCDLYSLGDVGYRAMRGILRYHPSERLDVMLTGDYTHDAHYNAAEVQIALTENAACDALSATVALGACQTALSAQRQLTIVYDNALRAIPFSGSAATEVNRLLGDDAAIEKLLEQAATAPAVAVIATLQQQVIPLLATAASDAAALRSAIGLPAPT